MHEWGLAELGNCQPTVGGDLNIINRERDRGCGDASCLRRGISRFSRLATRWVGRHQARGCVVAKYQIFAGASHRNVVASIAGIAFTMSQDDSGPPPAPPRPLPQHTHTHHTTTPPPPDKQIARKPQAFPHDRTCALRDHPPFRQPRSLCVLPLHGALCWSARPGSLLARRSLKTCPLLWTAASPG